MLFLLCPRSSDTGGLRYYPGNPVSYQQVREYLRPTHRVGPCSKQGLFYIYRNLIVHTSVINVCLFIVINHLAHLSIPLYRGLGIN